MYGGALTNFFKVIFWMVCILFRLDFLAFPHRNLQELNFFFYNYLFVYLIVKSVIYNAQKKKIINKIAGEHSSLLIVIFRGVKWRTILFYNY